MDLVGAVPNVDKSATTVYTVPVTSGQNGLQFGVQWYVDPNLIGEGVYQKVHHHWIVKDTCGNVIGTFDYWAYDLGQLKSYTGPLDGMNVEEAYESDISSDNLQNIVKFVVDAYEKRTGKTDVQVGSVQAQSCRDWYFMDYATYIDSQNRASGTLLPQPSTQVYGAWQVTVPETNYSSGRQIDKRFRLWFARFITPINIKLSGEILEFTNYNMVCQTGQYKFTSCVNVNTTGQPVDRSDLNVTRSFSW